MNYAFEKNRIYKNKEDSLPYTFVDYIFYDGTGEHSYTFFVNGSLKKIVIKDKEEFKKKFDFGMEEANNNTVTELRSILFKSMRDVVSGQLEVNKATAVSGLASQVVNSAKVELEYRKLVKGNVDGIKFFK
jgi:hypothetical protein